MRPLDRLPSIRVKLGVVIVATVAGTVLVLRGGARLGIDLPLRVLIATALGLLLVRFLAHGIWPARRGRWPPAGTTCA